MALRAAMLALGLCVGVFGGLAGGALAAGPGPEPAPSPPAPGLHPDPAPSAQPAPSSSSSSSSRSVSTVNRALPVVVAPTTAAVTPPPPVAAKPAGANSVARATVGKPPRRVAGRSHMRPASGHRFARLAGLLFDRASLRAIGGQAAAASGSRESRLLLAGGLALVLLVIGETTFLALAGARLGFRPNRRPRRTYRHGKAA